MRVRVIVHDENNYGVLELCMLSLPLLLLFPFHGCWSKWWMLTHWSSPEFGLGMTSSSKKEELPYCLQLPAQLVCVCVSVSVSVSVSVRLCVCRCVSVCLSVCVGVCVCVCLSLSLCVNISPSLSLWVWVCTYIHGYI